ncbi:MAG TPA: 16S rRNA (cytidine(1402)-2'-O)-methyltransferase [Bacteroidia bacterium]|nr:16S rRNA (cytidine(1402)-2'-O)-methyltransferase [Sphingobacteriales bacterium]HPD64148.1 16S rRNA (cytidine(1402)-2'-O)-methyltransferase [Bacteroidia bacterium]HRS57888.1 16S rRNA (cytidine(1402)-2'-O)-methyltransferase [Bacteroidia bacterium]HRU68472.1 16S rRNA (cytidine(1402)-2'-O)-methyltransferase [Bacteroidia bacterium]
MGKLYIVPTPIGNLEDITLRAIHVLKTVDLILAEDTRQSSKLLNKYQIKTPLKAFHQYNEHKIVENVIENLKGEKNYALVSDAGTPGISDPAYLIVNQCIVNEIPVECLPGATAFVPAIVESGLPCSSFVFEGFLPHKKGKLSKIKSLSEETRTIVFYESPFRLLNTLELLNTYFGEERKASVSREISKIHAETIRGTLADLSAHFRRNTPKGEIVIVVHGKDK